MVVGGTHGELIHVVAGIGVYEMGYGGLVLGVEKGAAGKVCRSCWA